MTASYTTSRDATVTLPSVTLREVTTARRTLLKKGRGEVNMRTIMRTVMAQRELIDAAVKNTAAARRGKISGSKSKVDDSGWGSLRGVDSSKPVPFVEDTD